MHGDAAAAGRLSASFPAVLDFPTTLPAPAFSFLRASYNESKLRQERPHSFPIWSSSVPTLLCRFCGSTDLRLSRFRSGDFSHLFSLLYPTRCRACRNRELVPLRQALTLRGRGTHRQHAR